MLVQSAVDASADPWPRGVLVIGGGPAGLAFAIAARLKGFDVTVLEADRPPIDKACGEAILAPGVRVLADLGVDLCSSNHFILRGIRFVSRGTSAEACFSCGPVLGVRRTTLHKALTARASELGVQFLWQTRLSEASLHLARGWVVGADGQNSVVRRTSGLDACCQLRRLGSRRHYRIPPWTDFVEVYWGRNSEIYITPISNQEVGVALLSRDIHLRLDTALGEFPELDVKLRGARASSSDRGALTISRRLPAVYRGRIALIGDASGSVDAITGDGLTLSFLQAAALAEAMSSGDLRSYQTAHRRLMRRAQLASDLLLILDRFPWLRHSAIRVLASYPSAFSIVLSCHADGKLPL